MRVIKFTAIAMASMVLSTLLMTLAFDAWVWEQDGHCGDSIAIHYLRDCK